MKPENFRERKKSLVKLGILCLIAIVLLGIVFLLLNNHEAAPNNVIAETKYIAARPATDNYAISDSILRLQANRHPGRAQKGANVAVEPDTIPSSKIDPLLPRKEQAGPDPDVQLSKDNALLRQRLEELQQSNAAANVQLTNLQHSNETLLIRLNEARTSVASSRSGVSGGSLSAAEGESQIHAVAVSNSNPERSASGESEELLFAQVDCNMSRADSRQIIYNARQRKDLLMDALTTLNGLARSTRADIQNKARAKIAQLRTIASTIHD